MDPNGEANSAERVRAARPGNTAKSEPLVGWRRWFRPVVYVIYGLLVVAATVLIIIDFTKQEIKFIPTLALVGFFAMVISIPISLWGIINHTIYFTRPSLQKYIIRILWTVPMYVLMSSLALRFRSGKVYFDALRQLYEALAVFNFVFYMVAYFADEVPDLERSLAEKPKTGLPIPLCRVKRQPTLGMVHKCKIGVLSYTVIRIISTIVILVAYLVGHYEEDLTPSNPYFWVCIIVTITQVIAMFSLNLIRMATYEELQPLPRFFKQFVGINLLIFVTNYQGTIINLIAKTGVFDPKPEWGFGDKDKLAFATMVQDLVICFEMVALAAFLTYSFDYKRYDTDEPKQSCAQIFLFMWTATSLKSSVIDHLPEKGNSTNGGYQGDHVQSQQPPAAVDGVYPSLQHEPRT